jgi:hypothetical protein
MEALHVLYVHHENIILYIYTYILNVLIRNHAYEPMVGSVVNAQANPLIRMLQDD